jgi:WD40 repeat protein
VWDLGARPAFAHPVRGDDHLFGNVVFSPDGRMVAAADDAGVWLVSARSATARVVRRLRAGDVAFRHVAIAGDGRMLAVDAGNSVQLWNLRRHRMVPRLPSPGGEITALAFDSTGHTIAVSGDDGTVRLWDVPERRRLGRPLHTRGVVAEAFVDDRGTLATAAGNGSVELWDTRRSRALAPRRRPLHEIPAAAFSADGRTVAFGNSNGTVLLWSARSAAPPAPLPGGTGPAVAGLAFSRDGRTLAVATERGEVRLWDVRAHRPLGRPLRHRNYATGVAFSPDGRVLASSGDTIRLWKGILWRDLADLRAQVCGLVIGELTRLEWRAIAPGIAYRTTC